MLKGRHRRCNNQTWGQDISAGCPRIDFPFNCHAKERQDKTKINIPSRTLQQCPDAAL